MNRNNFVGHLEEIRNLLDTGEGFAQAFAENIHQSALMCNVRLPDMVAACCLVLIKHYPPAYKRAEAEASALGEVLELPTSDLLSDHRD